MGADCGNAFSASKPFPPGAKFFASRNSFRIKSENRPIGYVAQEGVVELAPTYSGSANTRAIGYTFTLPDGTTETVGNLVVTIDTQLQKTASIT